MTKSVEEVKVVRVSTMPWTQWSHIWGLPMYTHTFQFQATKFGKIIDLKEEKFLVHLGSSNNIIHPVLKVYTIIAIFGGSTSIRWLLTGLATFHR